MGSTNTSAGTLLRLGSHGGDDEGEEDGWEGSEEEDGGEWDEEEDEERVYEGERRTGERALPIQRREAADMGEVGG